MKIALTALAALAITSANTSAQTRADIEQSRAAMRAATAAFKAGKLDEYRAAVQQAVTLRPDFPTGIYMLAQAYTRTGDTGAALAQLELLARMGMEFDPADDTAFARIAGHERFRAIAERERTNKQALNHAIVSDSFGGTQLHPDGIAYDAAHERFCIGSIRQGTVVCRGANSAARVYGVSAGLWSVIGTAFAPNGRLWLATTALPERQGFTKELRGKTAVVELDLARDEVVTRIDAPNDSVEHSFGDVAVAPDGTVFVSDGAGTLFRIRGKQLEAVGKPYSWVAPQGITFTPDGKQLFVADYSRGVFRVDPVTGATVQLRAPDGSTLLGVDGLSYYKGSLIGIQNGVRPYRVVRLRLDDSAGRVTAVETIEASHTLFDEPTTGVVVGDRYYFIANSHWPKFEGGKTPTEPLSQPIILSLPLR